MTPHAPLRLAVVALASLLAIGCGSSDEPAEGATDAPGARLAIAVAPLDLPAVGDAEYRLTVATPAETVWTRDVRSSAFGDGAGSLSYVGPCDADANPNTVTVEVLGLYTASGAVIGDWVNPGPLARQVDCEASSDVSVTFDITIARNANQGFFDVAVSFDDVFCSAKLDCVDAFLHNDGERDTTVIVAFACTTGAGTATFLHLDTVRLACSDGTSTEVVPTEGPGNTGTTGPHVFGAATYRGAEQLAPYDKCYWNTAIGLDMTTFAGDTTTDCNLTASATASQVDWQDGETPEDAAWPWISWSVPLVTDGALVCSEHPLNVPGSGVTTEYVRPGDAPLAFDGVLDCSACAGASCPAKLHGSLCTGTLSGLGDPVIFRDTPEGMTVTVGEVESAAMPLPAGYTLEGCCLDPCCAE